MIEPFAIMNLGGSRVYKFLFRDFMTDENVSDAIAYIERWASNHGWVTLDDRRKIRPIPAQVLFEIRMPMAKVL